ncbi:ArsR/SmtB family transcription factor [bacterium]
MTIAKSEGLKEETIRLAEFAKALSHPARIRILEILAEKNTCVCGEIVDLLPHSQSTVSQHLKELKKAGLIQGEIEGPKTCYCIDPKTFTRAREMFQNILSKIGKCC